ncbi:hypothetical protein N7519_007285 [Penicillium mononematosum]|uniref:uncharacterized protein n=1 Tax=Penicillium mononematosum TaxID=268346 RepID=UPI0025495431|nr:uncharacterized protein N7519_007285 [Penicillium mononematosum]KAJ6185984.1 hypothetical protein N7519_007285 [Penicillium mononematosum]
MRYRQRVQQADHATLQPPAPGSGEHYMISRELARWHKQRHLHGQPAGHATGTTRQPLGDGDVISSPRGWQYGTTAAICEFSRLTMPLYNGINTLRCHLHSQPAE